jgi:hypothetical protein
MLPTLRLSLVVVTLGLSACGDVAGSADSGSGTTFPLTVALGGDGTGSVVSTPSGIQCGADCTESFVDGTSVTLTPTGTGGSTFAGWSGGACTGTGDCTFTIAAATTVTAMFTNQRTLTVTVTGTGTVTSNPAGITCGADCSEAYAPGTTVVLTPAGSGGAVFAGWGGACGGAGACGVTLTGADASVSAIFGTPVRIGHTTQFGQTVAASPGFLLGERIDVPTVTKLAKFGLIASAAGGNVKMALYADAAGKPGALVAQTASTVMAPGNLEIVPTVTGVNLPAGAYWIMAIYDVVGNIYYTTSATGNVVHYVSQPFANAMPNPFPTPTTYMDQSFNYYLVVL